MHTGKVALRVGMDGHQHFAAPAFHHADAKAVCRQFFQQRRWLHFMDQIGQYVALQAQRFEQFIEAHDGACGNIAVAIGCHLYIQFVVRGTGKLHARIPGLCAGTSGQSAQAELRSQFWRDHTGTDETILQPGMFVVDAAQDAHLFLQHVAFLLDDVLALDLEVHGDPARHDLIHQVAMTEQRGVVAQHLFLEYPELGETERQCDVIAQIAEIAQMIGDTFAFQQQGSHPQGAAGRCYVGNAFCRHGVGPGIGHSAVAAHTPGQFGALPQAHALETFLDTFVHVAEPFFQTQHTFADDGETEVTRLDDARMYRADRNLMHPLPFHLDKRIGVRLFSTTCCRIEILAQGEAAAVPGTVAQPFAVILAFMSIDAEHIVGRSLHAAGRREDAADIRIVRVICGQRHVETDQTGFIDQHQMQLENLVLLPCVAAPQRHQPAAAVVDLLTDSVQIIGRDIARPRGKRVGQSGQFQVGMFDRHIGYPSKAAAWRYQSAR